MKEFAASSRRLHVFRHQLVRSSRVSKFNAAYWDEYQKIVNLYEWEGTAGKPATRVGLIDYVSA